MYNFRLYGKSGFVNLIEELDAIAQILQGTAEDGRKILASRSINIEDVNEILGVVVDYKNKRIYQKNKPSKDINELANFGLRREILPLEAKTIDSEFIKGNQLKFTAYYYRTRDLKISEKRKEIVKLNVEYHLASRSVVVKSGSAYFCEGGVLDGEVRMDGILFISVGYELNGDLAVRPVFYLKWDYWRRTKGRKKKQEKIAESNCKKI